MLGSGAPVTEGPPPGHLTRLVDGAVDQRDEVRGERGEVRRQRQSSWRSKSAAESSDTVLGSPDRPVAVVVAGAIHLQGDVAVNGLLYGSGATWTGSGSNAGVRGAVVLDGSYQGDATPQFVYDAAVLARLKGAGLFTRVSGSWKDF